MQTVYMYNITQFGLDCFWTSQK